MIFNGKVKMNSQIYAVKCQFFMNKVSINQLNFDVYNAIHKVQIGLAGDTARPGIQLARRNSRMRLR
jgi:hypothetical protein